MFKKLYTKYYKSRKTVSKDQAKKLKKDILALKEDVYARRKQIEKFELLMQADEEHRDRYARRVSVHKEFIKSSLAKIEEIEMILLDS